MRAPVDAWIQKLSIRAPVVMGSSNGIYEKSRQTNQTSKQDSIGCSSTEQYETRISIFSLHCSIRQDAASLKAIESYFLVLFHLRLPARTTIKARLILNGHRQKKSNHTSMKSIGRSYGSTHGLRTRVNNGRQPSMCLHTESKNGEIFEQGHPDRSTRFEMLPTTIYDP